MSRRQVAGLVVSSILVIALGLVLANRVFRGPLSEEGEAATAGGSGVAAGGREIDLLFPGPGGLLYPEPRLLAIDGDPVRSAAAVVEALLAGPTTPSLRGPFPADTRLAGVDPGPPGTLFVELEPAADIGPWAVGSREELLAVYSLVNTLTQNVRDVERVAVVWSGVQRTTLAGHVDTSRPLTADMSWVVRRSTE